MTPIEYVLPDGVTIVPVRYLTWHRDDAAALEAHMLAEHLGNTVVDHLTALKNATKTDQRKLANRLAVEIRLERNTAFQDLLRALMSGKTEDEIQKAVNQCGETEYSEIMDICRSTPDWAERHLRTLTRNQPAALLSTLTESLKASESGRQLLLDTCQQLQPTLDSATK